MKILNFSDFRNPNTYQYLIKPPTTIISSNEEIFNKSKADYKKALKDTGFQSRKLEYKKTAEKQTKNRSRNINGLTHRSTKMLAQINLIDKHFPKDKNFHKIFNRNSVKVSYSCTENMKSIITAHKKLLFENTQYHNPTAESRINAHRMENAGAEVKIQMRGFN